MSDPILDADLLNNDTAYGLIVHHGDDMLREAATWYKDATGRDASRSDQFHGSMWRALREGSRFPTLRHAFQDTWPNPAVPVPLTPVTFGTLSVRGRDLIQNAQPYRARYLTALDLLARTDAEQDAFLDWARDTGFNGVRVLTMASITANLPPAQGLAKTRDLYIKLRVRGMGAMFIALADTKPLELDRAAMRSHVIALGAYVDVMDIPAIIQLANENAHDTQQDDLADLAFLRELRSLIPAHVPVSMGSNCCGLPDSVPLYDGGDVASFHLDRNRPQWHEVARIKHLIELNICACNEEPIGAGEIDEPGRRSSHPERFFAQGVLDRLGNIASVFHFSDGVQAVLPRPVQRLCAIDYIAGATLVPDDQSFRFVNDSIGDAATSGANWDRVFKLFSFINTGAGPSYVVALGVIGDFSATYANGWRFGRIVAERQGIQVIEVVR